MNKWTVVLVLCAEANNRYRTDVFQCKIPRFHPRFKISLKHGNNDTKINRNSRGEAEQIVVCRRWDFTFFNVIFVSRTTHQFLRVSKSDGLYGGGYPYTIARMSLSGLGCRLQTCSRLASEWFNSTFRAVRCNIAKFQVPTIFLAKHQRVCIFRSNLR